eukprot:2314587-Prymnesium_polylepis.1
MELMCNHTHPNEQRNGFPPLPASLETLRLRMKIATGVEECLIIVHPAKGSLPAQAQVADNLGFTVPVLTRKYRALNRNDGWVPRALQPFRPNPSSDGDKRNHRQFTGEIKRQIPTDWNRLLFKARAADPRSLRPKRRLKLSLSTPSMPSLTAAECEHQLIYSPGERVLYFVEHRYRSELKVVCVDTGAKAKGSVLKITGATDRSNLLGAVPEPGDVLAALYDGTAVVSQVCRGASPWTVSDRLRNTRRRDDMSAPVSRHGHRRRRRRRVRDGRARAGRTRLGLVLAIERRFCDGCGCGGNRLPHETPRFARQYRAPRPR